MACPLCNTPLLDYGPGQRVIHGTPAEPTGAPHSEPTPRPQPEAPETTTTNSLCSATLADRPAPLTPAAPHLANTPVTAPPLDGQARIKMLRETFFETDSEEEK